ncbi:MAG: hypothetical protein JF887_06915 [Candidatus Dormibacteraeota bacterium]|uniref:Uncharacterized protein n=1 Tax=Candidatus Amunia macphersoniae TaxID=3127014 RepID=A0A934KD31_9BACT|nr:hypothetical protein [Candidatus Dormibacteraeota bacterium]
MTDAGVVHRWLLGLAAALIVVIIAATLVLVIVNHARAILVSVTRSRHAVSRVHSNVAAIAELGAAATTTDRILAGALGIEAKVHLVADALERTNVPAGRGGR